MVMAPPPLLPFAWIVGVLLALCVTHHRKPSKPRPQSPPPPHEPSRSPPPDPPPAGTPRSWGRRRERKERSAEESIWMKTIILGERCRVPSDDDEDGGGGLNGRRPRHYRPRTPRSVPVSRTSSFLHLDDAASSPAFGAGD